MVSSKVEFNGIADIFSEPIVITAASTSYKENAYLLVTGCFKIKKAAFLRQLFLRKKLYKVLLFNQFYTF